MKKLYKYQIVKEEKQPNHHMLYLIRYKAANGGVSEKWIGQSQLRRYYQQDKLTGQLSEHVKEVLTREPIKPKGRGKDKLEPRMETDGPVYSELAKSVKWNVPDFEIEKPKINIKSYCYSDPNGRWHVIMCDGVEDEDTYPDQKWAQQMVDMYNNPSSDNEEYSG